MQPKAKTMTVGVNTVVAPPYIHRYVEDSKGGWRIQPTGYIKCFLDDDYGGPEQALDVAKAAMGLLTRMSNVELMQIYDPLFVVGVRLDGHLTITMRLTRGMHSSDNISIPAPYHLRKAEMECMGKAWAGQKVYEFSAKSLPSWFPLSCRQTAFEAWKKQVQTCAEFSVANTPL